MEKTCRSSVQSIDIFNWYSLYKGLDALRSRDNRWKDDIGAGGPGLMFGFAVTKHRNLYAIPIALIIVWVAVLARICGEKGLYLYFTSWWQNLK